MNAHEATFHFEGLEAGEAVVAVMDLHQQERVATPALQAQAQAVLESQDEPVAGELSSKQSKSPRPDGSPTD